MSAARYERIEEICGAAVELPPEERDTFLRRACGDDRELRREIDSLLEADAAAGGFLAGGTLGGRWPAISPPPFEAGQVLGAYRLKHPIGQGGMSTVYLAERADEEYRRQVAVKVIRRGMETRELLGRFLTERQVLAALDHPNIARMLDGGTAEGLPYLVMEYVDGEPVDVYCDRHQLSIPQRLALFRTVCAAVHYAHQNLVVHRDLKPSNILVTANGEPKLLDFGIAKLLDPELLGSSPSTTATWMRVLTPNYASPEQFRGQAITTSSDIYGLGAVLYQLLTGRLPRRLQGRSAEEVERLLEARIEMPSVAIATSESGTVRPERRVRPEQLRRQLAGDLDNVVLKCLHEDPPRRYASADQLSEDLLRHLSGLPVRARKDTFAYRTGKFLQRNRLPAGIAAVSLLLLAAAAFLLSSLSGQVTQDRMALEQERGKVEQVVAFLRETFDDSDPNEARGETYTAREILDRSATMVTRQLDGYPVVQGELMLEIGNVYLNLGIFDRAEEMFRTALGLFEAAHGPEHPQVTAAINDLATTLRITGDYPAAESLLRRALEIDLRLHGEKHPDTAKTLDNLASLLLEKGDLGEAEQIYLKTLALRRELLGDQHPKVAMTLQNLAVLKQDLNDLEVAEGYLRQALSIQRKVNGEEHLDTALMLTNLATVLHQQDDLVGAEKTYRQALALWHKLVGEEHPNSAATQISLAALLEGRGETAEAEALYRSALVRLERQFGDEHPHIALLLINLGGLVLARGDTSDAEASFQRALAIQKNLIGERHPDYSLTLQHLGDLSYYNKGDEVAAEKYYSQAFSNRREILGEEHPDTARSALGLGLSVLRRDVKVAQDLFRQAREFLPKNEPSRALADGGLGECLTAAGRYAEAEPLLLESHGALREGRLAYPQWVEDRARARLAELYQRWGKSEKILKID